MKQLEKFKRDNSLVDFLFQHKGAQNVVSSKEICEYLNSKGYTTSLDNVNVLIRKVMLDRRLPICAINSKGYYWGTTKQEIQSSIDDLQGRIDEMTKRIEHLKSFIIE